MAEKSLKHYNLDEKRKAITLYAPIEKLTDVERSIIEFYVKAGYSIKAGKAGQHKDGMTMGAVEEYLATLDEEEQELIKQAVAEMKEKKEQEFDKNGKPKKVNNSLFLYKKVIRERHPQDWEALAKKIEK